MFACRSEATAREIASEKKCYYGFSTFQNADLSLRWYAGSIYDLRKMGVCEVLDPTGAVVECSSERTTL